MYKCASSGKTNNSVYSTHLATVLSDTKPKRPSRICRTSVALLSACSTRKICVFICFVSLSLGSRLWCDSHLYTEMHNIHIDRDIEYHSNRRAHICANICRYAAKNVGIEHSTNLFERHARTQRHTHRQTRSRNERDPVIGVAHESFTKRRSSSFLYLIRWDDKSFSSVSTRIRIHIMITMEKWSHTKTTDNVPEFFCCENRLNRKCSFALILRCEKGENEKFDVLHGRLPLSFVVRLVVVDRRV